MIEPLGRRSDMNWPSKGHALIEARLWLAWHPRHNAVSVLNASRCMARSCANCARSSIASFAWGGGTTESISDTASTAPSLPATLRAAM